MGGKPLPLPVWDRQASALVQEFLDDHPATSPILAAAQRRNRLRALSDESGQRNHRSQPRESRATIRTGCKNYRLGEFLNN